MNSTTNKPNLEQQGKYLTPFQRKLLEKNLEDSLSAQHHQRISIMLLADEDKSQTEICKILNCSPATARHWIFMAKTGMAHKWQDHPIGRPKVVNDEYIARLKELVNQNPRECGYGFQKWTGQWLSKHLAKELGITVNARHVNRLLKQMGLSTRPQPQKPTNQEKETSSRISIGDLSSAYFA